MALQSSNKILLVNLVLPNEKNLFPPFGLISMATALESKKFQVQIFHEPASSENILKLAKLSKECFLVGFYTMTSKALGKVLMASEIVKANGCTVVWGGPHATLLPVPSLKETSVDFVVRGEGEKTMVLLASALLQKKNFRRITGIAFKEGDTIVVNPIADLITDFSLIKMDWSKINVERYLKKMGSSKRVLPFVSSRGCPHRCGFCYNLSVNKRRWRGNGAERVIGEINDLKKKYSLDGIYFLDDNFFTNKKRALEILKGIKLPFFAEIRADYLNEALTKRLSKLGCLGLYIGAESGANSILKKIQKDITREQIEAAVRLCNKFGIKPTLSFMMFFPNETNSERSQTLDFILYLVEKYNVAIEGPKVFTPYPGTQLFEECKRLGWSEPKTTIRWSFLDRSISLKERDFTPKKDFEKYSALLFSLIAFINLRNERGISKFLLAPLAFLEKTRVKKKIYFFPIEAKLYFFLKTIIDRAKKSIPLNVFYC